MNIEVQVEAPSRKKTLEFLNQIIKRPALDLEFENLKYSVRDGNFKGGRRQILHSINGKFRCGQLTAILGPSGAGKTTLLNVLAGYVKNDVQGSIKLSGIQEATAVNKMSTYIMQENIIQPLLTVKESMMYAAGFKLGPKIKHEDKMAVIDELTELLGLEKCVDTFSEYLSGGEKKRLTIALELFNNPSILFLDEPTTGLDSFTVKQCMNCLKKISGLNCTVVVTIHQPPASLLQLFDLVYILADGFCVYNGPPGQLIPFLSANDCPCPLAHTPAEYIIEQVHMQPSTINTFKEAIKNGSVQLQETAEEINDYKDFKKSVGNFSTPFYLQFYLLLSRMWLQIRRNKISICIQLFSHITVAILTAAVFRRSGNDASRYFSLIMFCIFCAVFITFAYMITSIMIFPSQVRILQREYFNRWYNLKAYYSALIISRLPLLVPFTIIFCSIVYFWTGHPMEFGRYFGFCLIFVSMACTSQALGYIIGSVLNEIKGTVVGSLLIAPLILFTLYGLDYKVKTNPFLKIVTKSSYLRTGFEGLVNALFYKRGPLECHKEYCHYVRMDQMMEHMSVYVTDYKYQLGIMWIFTAIFLIMGYTALKCKLNNELSLKVRYYISKIIKFK